MNFLQRFGGSVNLNVHFHVVVPDVFFYRSTDEIGEVVLKRPSGGKFKPK